MAQHDYDLANGTGAAFRADANAALAAILTNNSGASEPTTRQAYMLWADTTAGQLKQRNAANNGWVVIGTLGSPNLGLVPANGGTQTNALGSASAPSYSFTSDANCGMFSPGADIIGFSCAGTERARVSAQGYLKAANNGSYNSATGTFHEINSSDGTNPALRVLASNASYASSAISVVTNRDTTNATYRALEYINTATANVRFAVQDSGLVTSLGSYNSTTANAANLNIDTFGNIQRSTSSGIYKTDIQPVSESTANVILALQPVRYRSLSDGDNHGWSYYGLIAEDVAECDPRLVHWGYRDDDYECVTVDEQSYNEETEEIEVIEVARQQLKDGAQLKPEGVQYERIGVLTLAKVQQHEARIAELESKIKALESMQ